MAASIFGGAGDDLLYGDFERGIDVINLSQLGVDFSDLTINGNVVTINGIAPSDLTITVTGSTLTESDFVFH